MNEPTDRLLVIDDDVELCALVAEYLEPEGFQLEAVHEADDGVRRALSGEFALIILDVMLPGASGFEVLRRVRAESDVPIIMLTARGDDVDRIVGLEIGADDYLPKPFNPRELVARIRAILRRTTQAAAEAAAAESQRLTVSDVEIDMGSRSVWQVGRPVALTAVEYELLLMLMRHAGQVVERNRLSRAVLGRSLSPYDRSLDMHISNLRKKLGHKVDQIERIKTVRGVGYVYAIGGSSHSETSRS